MAELKPCPFCGGEAGLTTKNLSYGAIGAVVACKECGAKSMIYCVRADWCANDMATNAWNRRAEDEKKN